MMPIHIPGKRNRRGHANPVKRNAVAVLQLTAMVDMFTVLVVFLLQNYATTNQILPLPEAVQLPDASTVKELKPSNVVLLSKDGVVINSTNLASFEAVKNQQDWLLQPLKAKIEELIAEGEKKKANISNQIRQAVSDVKRGENPPKPEVDDFRKITIQADKTMDFLSVKKIMYTVTEAGIYEINFAVVKRPEAPKAN